MQGKKAIFLAIMTVILTSGAVWFQHRNIIPKEVTWEDVIAEASRGTYQIITTDELWEHHQRRSETLLLVDTRQEWEYQTGHIKGALNFPVEPTWWSTLLKRGQLKAFLGSDKNRLIVFY